MGLLSLGHTQTLRQFLGMVWEEKILVSSLRLRGYISLPNLLLRGFPIETKEHHPIEAKDVSTLHFDADKYLTQACMCLAMVQGSDLPPSYLNFFLKVNTFVFQNHVARGWGCEFGALAGNFSSKFLHYFGRSCQEMFAQVCLVILGLCLGACGLETITTTLSTFAFSLLVCAAYVLISVTIDLSIARQARMSAKTPEEDYVFEPMCAVLLTEGIKLLVSLCRVAGSILSFKSSRSIRSRHVWVQELSQAAKLLSWLATSLHSTEATE